MLRDFSRSTCDLGLLLYVCGVLVTSVSSESDGDGDESLEEVGVPSRVAGVPQGELSRSTFG